MSDGSVATATAERVTCAECGTTLGPGQDRETTEQGTFCRPCFERLKAQVEQAVRDQSTGINYFMAAVGGVLGGALGAVAWWAFTVLTKIAFGLVAVVIGFAVGRGVVLLSGGKRSVGLQGLSVAISAIAFGYASYLVNRTFILRAMSEQGEAVSLPLAPDPGLLFRVVSLDFGIMDAVFLAIVLYQAWKIPAPMELAA